jgi:hypothetical protein
MARIIAAHVEVDTRAETIRQALERDGVAPDDIQKFYTPPAGQHAAFPIGGDVQTDEGARAAPPSARRGIIIGAIGGAVVGVLAGYAASDWGPLAGAATVLMIALLGTAIGAFIGAMYGAMRGLTQAGKAVTGREALGDLPPGEPRQERRRREAVPVRRGGLMLAICVRQPAREAEIIALVERAGAQDVEWADGRWEDGGWADFNPVDPPRLVRERRRDFGPHVSTADAHR